MVITFPAHAAETPVGKPFAPDTPLLEIPVTPTVAWVIGVKAVLIHNVGVLDAAAAARFAVTVMVPVAFIVPQPPVNGML